MKNNVEITKAGLGRGMGTAAGGSYGCVGDEAVCEQQAQPWLPRGLSTLSATPSYTVQGVSLCNHSAPETQPNSWPTQGSCPGPLVYIEPRCISDG